MSFQGIFPGNLKTGQGLVQADPPCSSAGGFLFVTGINLSFQKNDL